MNTKNIRLLIFTFLTAFSFSTFAAKKSATYEVTFINNWNAKDHLAFPQNAHYSPIVAVSHNNSYELFSVGGFATPGFESLAEIGDTGGLLSEIQTAQNRSQVSKVVVTEALFPHRDGNTISFSLIVSEDTPILSFATMIAPSPDWIVGVSNLNTFIDGEFVESVNFDLYAINAGTEEGDFAGNFSIRNQPTVPQQTISLLSGIAGLDVPFAFIEIKRVN